MSRVVRVSPIPSSTPLSIVFPYDSQAQKFSTSSYMPLQTQNRASLEEIEQFLDQANAPIKEWYAEFGYLQEGSAKMTALLIICTIIMPLIFFFLCWITAVQNKSAVKLKEASEKAKLFIRDNGQQFIDKGLLWNIPTRFPHWIELWTSLEGPPQMGLGQPGFGGFQQPGIQTMPVQQQNYQNMQQQGYLTNQNMQQNQYSGNTFSANV